MELKISKVRKDNRTENQNVQQESVQSSVDQSVQAAPRETVTFENGVSVHKQGGRYFLSVGEQELEVTEGEVLMVTANHDYAFELIMEKRGKFWFNASLDNVGLSRETI